MQTNTEQKNPMVITDHYYSLSEADRKRFRDSVMTETGISMSSFYYKMRNGNWRTPEKTIVINLINRLNNAGENRVL